MTKHSWTTKDILKLFETVQKLGKNWEHVKQTSFPSISPKGLRNMYYKVLREDPEIAMEYSQQVEAKAAVREQNNQVTEDKPHTLEQCQQEAIAKSGIDLDLLKYFAK